VYNLDARFSFEFRQFLDDSFSIGVLVEQNLDSPTFTLFPVEFSGNSRACADQEHSNDEQKHYFLQISRPSLKMPAHLFR